MRPASWAIGSVLLAIGTGCSPSLEPTETVAVAAFASPAAVSAGDSLQVGAVYRNDSDQPVEIGFGMGCPFFLTLLPSDGGPIDLEGSTYLCTAAVSRLTIPARDSAKTTIQLMASVAGDPVAPGVYTARLEFTNGRWVRETEFVVR